MTDSLYIRLILNSHDADDFIVINITREPHAILDLRLQLCFCHILLLSYKAHATDPVE